MNRVLVAILAILVTSCSSSIELINKGEDQKTVSLDTSEYQLISSNKWFSEAANEKVLLSEVISETGETILEGIVNGYSAQIGNYFFIDSSEQADVTFRVIKIEIKKRNFTLNFVKPGPLYLMKIEVEITLNEIGNNTVTKKSIINMAEVNYPDQNYKWMSVEEKNDIDNQMATFNVGLRKMYQDLFFEAFDISLQL